jgi:glutaconate CoA-transferase subunit B
MDTDTPAYNSAQLMVAAAAREIRNHEIIFVGMRLPLLGFLLAKSLHAPDAIGIYELGIVRDRVAPEPIMTMGDLPNLYQAMWLADTADAMSLLQQGRVDVSFLGGAQVDRFGNLNTTQVGDWNGRFSSLPGSGGACDLASLAKRHILVMAHEKRRFVERVDYITSPGYGDGPGWRQRVGLPRGGPSTVITTLGIFNFDPDDCQMVLKSVHPGVSVEMVQEHTGWPLKVAKPVQITLPPTASELNMLKQFDPAGFWTGKQVS